MNPWVGEDGRLRAGWRALLGFFVAYLCSWLALEVAMMLPAGHPRLFEAVYRPAAMVLLLGGFSLLLLVADGIEDSPLSAMGLNSGRQRFRQAVMGVLLGGAMIGLAVPELAVWADLTFHVQLNSHTALLAAVEVYVLATGAMAEEVAFRGYPFQRLIEGVGPILAVAIMSALFAAVHLSNPGASVWGFINTIGVGILLSLAYLRTRSLWLPWGIHFGWNATLGLLLGLPVSGIMDFAVLVKGSAHGPQWLTGGAYGLEASALGSLAIALGCVGVLVLTRPPAGNSSQGNPSPGGSA